MEANLKRFRCTTCFKSKLVSEFDPRPSRPCGHASKCKVCRRIAKSLRDATPQGRAVRHAYARSEAGKAAHRRYEDAHPGRSRLTKQKRRTTTLGRLIHERSHVKHRMIHNKTEWGRDRARRDYDKLTHDIELHLMRGTGNEPLIPIWNRKIP